MQYFNLIKNEQIRDLILNKSIYQRVLVLTDSCTNLDMFEKLEKEIKDKTIFFCYNVDLLSEEELKQIFSEDYRCVLLWLGDKNYLEISKYYTFYAITIDVFEGRLFLLRLKDLKEYYLFYNDNALSCEDKLFIANYLVETEWRNLLSYKSNFKNNYLLQVYNRSDVFNCETFKNFDMAQELTGLNEESYELFLFVRIMAIKYLFLSFVTNSQQMIDIYKLYENDLQELNFVYLLYSDERANFVFKNYNKTFLNSIETNMANIKPLSHVDNGEIFRILKIIHLRAKTIKKDNLLKYCFLYGIFEKV